MAPNHLIRPATTVDLDALVALENRSFTGDRLSRRSLRHLLTRAHATALVAAGEAGAHGYVLVRYRDGSRLARLYSIAVDRDCRGQGVATALVHAAERAAREAGRTIMRLEVRSDNAASLALFHRLGYREFGIHRGYYEDAMDAVRLERSIP